MFQCVAVCCSELQSGAMRCSMLRCVDSRAILGSSDLLRCVFIHKKTRMHALVKGIGWRRPIGCLVLKGSFPQKSPAISGSFAETRRMHARVVGMGWLRLVGSFKL